MHGCMSRCIEQAELVLSEYHDDPKAYLWLALAFKRVEDISENKINKILPEGTRVNEIMCEELSCAMAALSLEFSQQDISISRILEKNGSSKSKTKVVTVASDHDLKTQIMAWCMRFSLGLGERPIFLVKEGIYELGFEDFTKIGGCILIGDLSQPKPVVLLKDENIVVPCRMVFINIHFKIDNGIVMVRTQDRDPLMPIFFIKCTIVKSLLQNLQ